MNYLNLLISVVITFLAYAIFPFCYLIINKKIFYIDDKKLKKILIINSVIVSLFFAIISFLLYPNDYKINFAPALFYYWINLTIYKNNKNLNTENENFEKTGKLKIITNIIKKCNITIIIMLISIIINIFTVANNYKLKTKIKNQDIEIKDQSTELHEISNELFNVLQGYSTTYTINKLNFLNNKIVFVIDGYEKYYMDYDCMRRKTLNTQYSFLAFNEENAIRQGYKKYNCSIITKNELDNLNKYG